MLKFFSTLTLALSFATTSFSQTSSNTTTPAPTGPQISVNKEMHDYGTVEYAGNGVCEFVVTNTGDQPLVIQEAKASCGCTVPSFPTEPIAPGESAVIYVKYDTKRPGSINKSIKIKSNATNEEIKVVYIKGQVKQQADNPVQTGQNKPASSGSKPSTSTAG
jgi:hypothetical protein